MSDIILGVVGCGEWSHRMHMPAMKALAQRGGVRYAGICDLDEAKARAYANDLGEGRAFIDIEEMLSVCSLDGLILLVRPPAVTIKLIEFAAERKLPFLVEKPPAPDSKIQKRIIEKLGDVIHVIAYNRRHSPYIRQAREWLQDCPLQSVTAMFSRSKRREPDFSGTAVHAIDTAGSLAGSPLKEAVLEMGRGGEVPNYYISAWTAERVRVDILITPDTGSATEHYIIRSQNRTVSISFPQPPMIDVPGWVELHEENKVIETKGPADFGMAPEDLSGLGGIQGEHEIFIQALKSKVQPESSLADTLQTQIIREELSRMLVENINYSKLEL